MLRDIARQTRNENLAMTELTKQGRKDARSLKALSILGTLYLPATLIAVSHVYIDPEVTMLMADENRRPFLVRTSSSSGPLGSQRSKHILL